MAIEKLPKLASTADTDAPAANTAAVITYAASTGFKHAIGNVHLSYDGAPTGGNLKIEDGSGTTVFSVDVTAAGPDSINFDPPLMGSEGTALIITLAAGGAGVTGKVNAQHWTH